jgi:hypothetical protein
VTPNVRDEPWRPMIAPAAVGCKRLMGGGWPDVVFAFKMTKGSACACSPRIAKKTGLTSADL